MAGGLLPKPTVFFSLPHSRHAGVGFFVGGLPFAVAKLAFFSRQDYCNNMFSYWAR